MATQVLPSFRVFLARLAASARRAAARGSGSNGTVNALKPSTCPQTSALSGEYDKTTVL